MAPESVAGRCFVFSFRTIAPAGLALCLVATGCEDEPGTDKPTEADVGLADSGESDLGVQDIATVDTTVDEPDPHIDPDPEEDIADVTADQGIEPAACPGGPMCACKDNKECDNSLCI